MSDEISEARKKKRRKYNRKRISRFLVALALVLAAAVAVNTFTATTMSDIGDFFRATFSLGSWPAELGSSETLQSERMSLAFASATSSQLIVISRTGARLLEAEHSFVAPFITASGNRVALCNRGSRDVRVFNRSEELASFSTDGAIVDAAMSGAGTLAVLTGSERYTCELRIYKNGLYEAQMSWKGAQGFPLLAAISPDGKRAAAVTVSVAGGRLDSTVTVVDVSRESEQSATRLGGLATDIVLANDGGFTAVTLEAAYRVDTGGNVAYSYDFDHMPLLDVSADGGKLALAFGDNSIPDVNRCVVLDRTLEPVAQIDGCGEVDDLLLSGDRVTVLGAGRARVFNFSAAVIKVYKTDIKAQKIVEFSSIIEIMPDRAQKAEPVAADSAEASG